MRLKAELLLGALVAVLAACGAATTSPPAGGATPSPALPTVGPTAPASIPDGTAASLPPAVTAAPPATAMPANGGRIVDVTLTDALRIEPAEIAVQPGRPVTFVVTNAGALDHEFFLGDEAAQAQREAQVTASDGVVPPAAPNGISVEPGMTAELTFTFSAPGEWQAGCHIQNHYAGGMKTTITVAE